LYSARPARCRRKSQIAIFSRPSDDLGIPNHSIGRKSDGLMGAKAEEDGSAKDSGITGGHWWHRPTGVRGASRRRHSGCLESELLTQAHLPIPWTPRPISRTARRGYRRGQIGGRSIESHRLLVVGLGCLALSAVLPLPLPSLILRYRSSVCRSRCEYILHVLSTGYCMHFQPRTGR
jgi:hypothetical protein